MLSSIHVAGFKTLLDLPNTDLEFGLVNVFIGANGSGKSNLLDALGLLGAAASGRVDDQELLRRGVRPGAPALYKTSLKNERFRPTISLGVKAEWQGELISYDVSLDNPIDTPRPSWQYRTEKVLRGDKQIVGRSPNGISFSADLEQLSSSFQNLDKDAGLAALVKTHPYLSGAPFELLELLQNYMVFSPTAPVLRGIQPDTSQSDPIGVFGGRLAEAVREILDLNKQMLGKMDLDDVFDLLDWVETFSISEPSRQLVSPSVPTVRNLVRFKDRWMRDGRNLLSGHDASEGALYVLFMLTLAMHPRIPRLFAVDNFDQAMHPRLARAVTRAFCTQILQATPGRQALITTHNPLVLDGLNLRDDRIRLFAVERDSSNGATRVYRILVSDDILKANQDGLSLSNLWVMGRLGGVPNI
jgi:energy-coupling factor transporter ATP-binding protein EcfA2